MPAISSSRSGFTGGWRPMFFLLYPEFSSGSSAIPQAIMCLHLAQEKIITVPVEVRCPGFERINGLRRPQCGQVGVRFFTLAQSSSTVFASTIFEDMIPSAAMAIFRAGNNAEMFNEPGEALGNH